ncbi:MAG TPA: SPOR domain-containing protein [Burkholderiales bacterium]|nr:SPOR domain-containing protein [Burkholderiales bacterium]
MKFLLWLSQQLDALGTSGRKVLLGVIGLAALAAVVFYGPALLERDSGPVPVRTPPSPAASKPLAPPAPVADKPIEKSPQPEPVKPIIAAAPPAPPPAPEPAPAPIAAAEPAPAPAEAPAPAPAKAPASTTYQVQLGAFQDEARAKRLAKRVARAGFPATVTPVDLPDRGRFYRVRLKPELTHAEAKQLLAKLHKKMPKQTPILVSSGS